MFNKRKCFISLKFIFYFSCFTSWGQKNIKRREAENCDGQRKVKQYTKTRKHNIWWTWLCLLMAFFFKYLTWHEFTLFYCFWAGFLLFKNVCCSCFKFWTFVSLLEIFFRFFYNKTLCQSSMDLYAIVWMKDDDTYTVCSSSLFFFFAFGSVHNIWRKMKIMTL